MINGIKSPISFKAGQSRLSKRIGLKSWFYRKKTIREWLKLYEQEGLTSLLRVRVGGNHQTVLSKQIIDYNKIAL
jgi:hypothetical protein